MVRTESVLVTLVRHGRTDWNAQRRLQGRTDVPLNDEGRRDAKLAADVLSQQPWHSIYTSPLGRAVETAGIIAEHLGLVPVVRECLIERSYGALEGTITRRRSLRSGSKGPNRRVPGMESDRHLRSRALTCINTIADAHPNGRLVVVSHGGFINAFLYHISNGRAGSGITRLANGSLTRVERDAAGAWQIVSLAESAHLKEPLGPTLTESPKDP